MQERPLALPSLVWRAEHLFGDKRVVDVARAGEDVLTYSAWADRVRRVAGAMDVLGIEPGDRVGSIATSTRRHLELYFGVPCRNRVLHTVNVRFPADQLAFVIDHARDRALFVEAALLDPVLAVVADLPAVDHLVVIGSDGELPAGLDEMAIWDYDDLLAEARPTELEVDDERRAAAICYTGGTTGNPKGVVYSHRSLVLHAIAMTMADTAAIGERDVVLPVVPLFHANAVGLAHAAVGTGATLVMPGPDLSGKALADIIVSHRVSATAGVPTVWSAVLPELAGRPVPDLRIVISGASAVPPALSARFEAGVGVPLTQIWGMTETSPLGTMFRPRSPSDASKLGRRGDDAHQRRLPRPGRRGARRRGRRGRVAVGRRERR